ncbi:VC0807 family protein [Lentibacillus sp.]|uniref:VC0807 family protein n=1 Tax=Lentibacillus sp. TaxID=1925746 RepID=UPI002B4B93D4|nr:VC0807 family protein [Lentibacillus sp.]HLS08117.1 VC0807 family protein [Lentibacillus sp.]
MNKKLIILDIICYAALPFLIWKYGRDIMGDYPAMLISTIPGFIYTIYRFILERQFNIAGLFVIGSLFIGTTVDLLSGSAEQMLWNGIYLGLFYVLVHLIALVLMRPLALYFAVDFVYLQGYPRKQSTALYYKKDIFMWFQLIQILFIVRGLFMAGLKTWLLQKYGVDGNDQMLIYRQISSWFFGLLITAGFFYTSVPVSKYFARKQAEAKTEPL